MKLLTYLFAPFVLISPVVAGPPRISAKSSLQSGIKDAANIASFYGVKAMDSTKGLLNGGGSESWVSVSIYLNYMAICKTRS
jgi:hypothetical protein